MVCVRALCVLSTFLSLTSTILANIPDLGPRAPFEPFGIDKRGQEAIAEDDSIAGFAPDAQEGTKNASQPLLMDRSLDLVNRQTCNSGYWYCSNFGKCCPRTDLCCSYGYCIDPQKTCCPKGPCDAGWGCCGSKCYPKGGDCCSNDNYCEAGNICVRLVSSGRIVCCTDLKCTAVVTNGVTSRMSTTAQASATRANTATITTPPQTTRVIVGSSSTWYWTVTWWYYSFYWSTIRATSTVTFTRIFRTTTYTTLASDQTDARSKFSALSATLSLPVPADAQTSLAALLSVRPTDTGGGFSNDYEPINTGGGSSPTTASAVASVAASASATGEGNGQLTDQGPGGGGASGATTIFVGYSMLTFGALSGLLMVWL